MGLCPGEYQRRCRKRAIAIKAFRLYRSIAGFDCIGVEFIEPIGLWWYQIDVLQQIEQRNEVMGTSNLDAMGAKHGLE